MARRLCRFCPYRVGLFLENKLLKRRIQTIQSQFDRQNRRIIDLENKVNAGNHRKRRRLDQHVDFSDVHQGQREQLKQHERDEAELLATTQAKENSVHHHIDEPLEEKYNMEETHVEELKEKEENIFFLDENRDLYAELLETQAEFKKLGERFKILEKKVEAANREFKLIGDIILEAEEALGEEVV